MSPARTLLAVLLGYLAFLVFGFFGGVFMALAMRARSGSGLLIGSEIVAFVAAAAAGAITARIAQRKPLAHAAALGLSVFSVTVVATIVLPRNPHAYYPSWYPFAAAVLGGVGAFVGGALVSAGRPETGSE